jgi:hypothetical protein
MFRTAVCVGVSAILMASVAPAAAQEGVRVRFDTTNSGPLLADKAPLRDSLDRIARGSALWREALETIAREGRRILVLTPDQMAAEGAGGSAGAIDAGVLAEVAPVTRDRFRVDTVMVVVNLPLIEQAHARRNSLPGEFHADLDRILIHEVYGHALPYLLAGDLSGRCADPLPGQRPADACAIQRENAVRAELRLGRRTDAGLAGLLLAWRQ